MLARLQSEVETCRVQQPFQIVVERNPQDRLTTAMEQVSGIVFLYFFFSVFLYVSISVFES